MNDIDTSDSWYKRCSVCNEWRITDMAHCWKCGEVLGPAHGLEDVIKSKQLAVTDTVQTRNIYHLWERAKHHGYEHPLPKFMKFFETLNKRKK